MESSEATNVRVVENALGNMCIQRPGESGLNLFIPGHKH